MNVWMETTIITAERFTFVIYKCQVNKSKAERFPILWLIQKFYERSKLKQSESAHGLIYSRYDR